jgi:hypothetical protein
VHTVCPLRSLRWGPWSVRSGGAALLRSGRSATGTHSARRASLARGRVGVVLASGARSPGALAPDSRPASARGVLSVGEEGRTRLRGVEPRRRGGRRGRRAWEGRPLAGGASGADGGATDTSDGPLDRRARPRSGRRFEGPKGPGKGGAPAGVWPGLRCRNARGTALSAGWPPSGQEGYRTATRFAHLPVGTGVEWCAGSQGQAALCTGKRVEGLPCSVRASSAQVGLVASP